MTNKRLLLILMSMIMLSPLGMDIFLPAMPEMAQYFATPMSDIQLCIALYIFASGVGQLVAGPIADRYGRLPLIKLGFFLYILGAGMSALAVDITWLWLARILQGLGGCALSVAVMSMARDSYSPAKITQVLSYIFGAIYVIPAFAPMLGSLLLHYFNWQANFVFMVLAGVIVLVIAGRYLIETKPTAQPNSQLPNWSGYKKILTHRSFMFNSIMVMLAMSIIIHYIGFAPIKLREDLDLNATVFAYWFGANAVLNIIGSFCAPKIISKIGNSTSLKLCVGANFLAAVLLLSLAQYQSPISFMLPVFISSLGLCFAFAVCSAQALMPFKHQAGMAAAMLGLIQMSGAATLVGLFQLLPLSGTASFSFLLSLPILWLALGRPLLLNNSEHKLLAQ